jgi:hypothetical protein
MSFLTSSFKTVEYHRSRAGASMAPAFDLPLLSIEGVPLVNSVGRLGRPGDYFQHVEQTAEECLG